MEDFVVSYLKKIKIPYVVITQELIELVTNKQNTIDQIIGNDLSSSFDQGFVVYCREVLTEEMLILLHNYFRNTCCNIENVVLIEVDAVGIKRFYQQYCQLHKTKGFNIVEIPWMYWCQWYVTNDSIGQLPKHETIKSLFSFYGGTYEIDPPERTIMALFASQYAEIAHIDTMFDPAKWQAVNDYLEFLSYFCDANAIADYQNLYNRVVVNSKFNIPKLLDTSDSVSNEKFVRQGPQWTIDSVSMFSLIRETNCSQNFYCLTEKTMRCFFHGVAPIFTHGEHIVDDIEDLGFKINKTFIDYSYLKEENLFFRLQKLKIELDKLKNISFDEWYSIWLDNYSMFNYNSEYLINSYKTNIIIPRLDNYFI